MNTLLIPRLIHEYICLVLFPFLDLRISYKVISTSHTLDEFYLAGGRRLLSITLLKNNLVTYNTGLAFNTVI